MKKKKPPIKVALYACTYFASSKKFKEEAKQKENGRYWTEIPQKVLKDALNIKTVKKFAKVLLNLQQPGYEIAQLGVYGIFRKGSKVNIEVRSFDFVEASLLKEKTYLRKLLHRLIRHYQQTEV